jgi:ApbE superfamily uncharacterized protein (UPF0280 family)
MSALIRAPFQYKHSNCTLISDKQAGIEAAIASIKVNSEQLESYGKVNPKFFWSLKPVSALDGPLVVKLMAEAAAKANVGPMAAVAGVLADLAVKDMVGLGCEVAVVEDGGEISAVSNVSIDVGFAAGDEPLSGRFGFRLMDFPAAVATSSGRFSHAFSFGDAEAATVFCREAGLADAAATAVGNAVKGDDPNEAIECGLDLAKSICGVEGALVLYGGCVGTVGKVPQIIKLRKT